MQIHSGERHAINSFCIVSFLSDVIMQSLAWLKSILYEISRTPWGDFEPTKLSSVRRGKLPPTSNTSSPSNEKLRWFHSSALGSEQSRPSSISFSFSGSE